MWPIVCLADMPGSKAGSFCEIKGRWGAWGTVCYKLSTINCPSLDIGSYNWRGWMLGHRPSSWNSQFLYLLSLLYMTSMCYFSTAPRSWSPSLWDWLWQLWLLPWCACYVNYSGKSWVLIWLAGFWCNPPSHPWRVAGQIAGTMVPLGEACIAWWD